MDFGVILDLETTGLDPKKDSIIEIGLIQFAVIEHSKPEIVECYSAVQDPGFSIPLDISEMTGLTDAIVKNRTIDWSHVKALCDQSSIIIAHNAEFDRTFIESQPSFSETRYHWGCSVRHVLWRKKGHTTRQLNYLAADHGFVNPFAHRALFDCATTFRLIEPHLSELVRNSYEPEILISASQAAYEKKDVLRSHGYKWDNEKRVWVKRILQIERDEEVDFLTKHVYGGTSRHEETLFPPLR